MQKLLVTVLLGIIGMQASLQGASLDDDFQFLTDIPLFVQFIEAARDDGDAFRAEQVRNQLLMSSQDPERKAVITIKSATVLARLYTELSTPDKDRAQGLLSEAEGQLKHLESNSFLSLILSAEIDSIAYMINPRSLGKGISSNSKINKAYELFPKQVYAILMKASSLLYAPRIAGGNMDKALTLYLQLLNQRDLTLSRWDSASVYSSIGIIAAKRKEWETAYGYLTLAKSLYGFDPTLDEYLIEVQEKR